MILNSCQKKKATDGVHLVQDLRGKIGRFDHFHSIKRNSKKETKLIDSMLITNGESQAYILPPHEMGIKKNMVAMVEVSEPK